MRIIVTGAAGFIGSNIVRALNERGIEDIIAVDHLKQPGKFGNLVGTKISDYFEKDEFLARLASGSLGPIEAIFHEGACSDTMEHDGSFVIGNNYRYTKDLFDLCVGQNIRLLYASSAATYGNSEAFSVDPANEKPLNVYGYSKLLFDEIARRQFGKAGVPQLAGFRYFNVYGPGESHKGRMASVAFHHMGQMSSEGHVRLFGAYGGFEAGMQSRDFIYVRDVVAVNLYFLDHPHLSGIFNVGTGRAEPFNEVAKGVINAWRRSRGDGPLSLDEQVAAGLLRYVDFPDALKGKYQSYTCADVSGLREVGYDRPFASVAEGIADYYGSIGGRL